MGEIDMAEELRVLAAAVREDRISRIGIVYLLEYLADQIEVNK